MKSDKLNNTSRCPRCGLLLDLWGNHENERTPSVGDIGVCHGCLNAVEFGENGVFYRIDRREFTEKAERGIDGVKMAILKEGSARK